MAASSGTPACRRRPTTPHLATRARHRDPYSPGSSLFPTTTSCPAHGPALPPALPCPRPGPGPAPARPRPDPHPAPLPPAPPSHEPQRPRLAGPRLGGARHADLGCLHMLRGIVQEKVPRDVEGQGAGVRGTRRATSRTATTSAGHRWPGARCQKDVQQRRAVFNLALQAASTDAQVRAAQQSLCCDLQKSMIQAQTSIISII
mgnify:CR=1 FL=1